MILLDLLKDFDMDELIDYMEKNEISSELNKEEKLLTYTDFVNRLITKTPVIDENEILIGYYLKNSFFEENDNRLFLDVLLYKKDELAKGRDKIEEWKNIPDESTLTKEEVYSICSNLPKDAPDGYAFDFSPWEEVLGAEVDIKNVEEVGKIPFISYMLEEMSFNGMWEDDQEERRNELFKRVEEVNEIMKLPKEEQEKHFTTVKLDELFPDIKDTRTPEEKEAENEKIKREILYNIRAKYNILKNYI